jgi:hypothetical protein
MCDTCAVPDDTSPLTRVVKLRLVLFALVTLVAAGAVLGNAVGGTAGHPATVAPAEHVFVGDMARQTEDARQLAAEATRWPGLADLVRDIEREDRNIARGAPAASGRTVRGEPRRVQRRAVQHAIRVHIEQDSVIARVERATGVEPAPRRAATRLLGQARSWLAVLGPG